MIQKSGASFHFLPSIHVPVVKDEIFSGVKSITALELAIDTCKTNNSTIRNIQSISKPSDCVTRKQKRSLDESFFDLFSDFEYCCIC